MKSVYSDDNIEIFVEDEHSSERRLPEAKEHECSCGRAVCCGKHKGCPNKIRFIGSEHSHQ